ncbi:MAG: insulinase family protein [Treponema sp.]|nr:insulinase family protein [Treponema sp.]
MDFTKKDNVGKEYKGFILLSIDDLPDYKAKGLYLRHKKTGLEIYHILADDKENLFAFGFRTIAKDSLGTAHIMEHSTLCGSEKYPLKEPFNTLASTSLNTFLNALTYPDKTVYPGASVVPADYFNMFDVYADSVFFPKLDHATFIQEGHRLEMDEKGKLSIQGVVYNEMKGNYSSFNSIAYSEQVKSMFPDSYPAFDSGGDPVDIPKLTYQQFLDFHQKFYNPDNCLLFLYGDIPIQTQLDYLDSKFMRRIEEKFNCKEDIPNVSSKNPLMIKEIQDLLKLKLNDKSFTYRTIAPETGATGSLVAINWYSGKADMEKLYLSEVLFGSDSSPVSKKLNESGLGDSETCGNFGQFEEEFFNIGLNGVKREDEDKVFDLIPKIIKEVYEKGPSQEEIDSAVMGVDFNLREENRYFGPPSIQLMEKAMKAWTRGKAPSSLLNPISSFEKVKEQLKKDKDFTKKLIKKYFIDQKIVVKFVAEPSNSFFDKRNELEKKLIKELEKNLDKEQLKKDLEELHAYQQKIESPEETACIPTTKIQCLEKKLDFPEVQLKFLAGNGNYQVPLFVSQEETKGLFYLDVLFPTDHIPVKDLKYLPTLTSILTNLGWAGKSWDQCITECGCLMGDIWGRPCRGFVTQEEDCQKVLKKYQKYNFMGRNWIGLSCKALSSKAEEAIKILSEIITQMDFKDQKRFKQLILEMKSEKKASIVSMGRDYAVRRARASLNKHDALTEIYSGLTQLETLSSLDKNPGLTLKKFEEIYRSCLKEGGIVHVTADQESLDKILPLLDDFVKATDIKELSKIQEHDLEEYLPYIYQVEDTMGDHCQQDIKIESQTGYAVTVSPCSKNLSKESIAESIFSTWFSSHSLWDKVRTTGGAYGAFSGIDPSNGIFTMSSYRDPTPLNTIKVFKEALEEIKSGKVTISDQDIEKTIVSCYGDIIVPQTAKGRGAVSFEKFIYGVTPQFRQKKIDLLFSISPEDVRKAAVRLYDNCEKFYRKAIFCDKSVQTCGKNIIIPL